LSGGSILLTVQIYQKVNEVLTPKDYFKEKTPSRKIMSLGDKEPSKPPTSISIEHHLPCISEKKS